MTKCPNDDCKSNFQREIYGHSKTLYGTEGTGGLVGCVKGKVSKKSVVVVVLSILGIIGLFTVQSLTAWSNAKDERKENKTSIAVLKSQYESINKNIEDIKEQQKKIINNQIDPKKLIQDIENILKVKGGTKK